jgi:hypothetical protein
MSWGAQSRSKDAKTPSAGRAMSEKPELDRCPIQPYQAALREWLALVPGWPVICSTYRAAARVLGVGRGSRC